jgi:hypothetical protein
VAIGTPPLGQAQPAAFVKDGILSDNSRHANRFIRQFSVERTQSRPADRSGPRATRAPGARTVPSIGFDLPEHEWRRSIL